MGCYFNKKDNTWHSNVSYCGKKRHLGSFKTEEEAIERYKHEILKLNEIYAPEKIIEYRDIPEYNEYKISPSGKILSFKRDIVSEILPSPNGHGYLRVVLMKNNKKHYKLLHRLLYETFCGAIPDNMVIDHIDRNKTNNNLSNLRTVTESQNRINTDIVDGANGCSYHKRDDLWRARINVNNKEILIGYFKKKEDAHLAYLEAKKKYHPV